MKSLETAKHISVAACCLVLAACGSDDEPDTTQPEAASTSAQSGAPAPGSKGSLTVVVNAPFPPYVEMENGSLSGSDVELTKSMVEAAGYKAKVVNQKNFDAIVPGMLAGRYDVAPSFTDSVERQPALTNVNMYKGRLALTGPAKITDQADLCGKQIGTLKGGAVYTAGIKFFNETRCAGNPAKIIEITGGAPSDFTTAVQSGRIDAFMNDEGASVDLQEKQPTFHVIGEPVSPPGIGFIGAVVTAKRGDLAKELQAGLERTIASGEYDRVIEKYGLQTSSYKDATINAAKL